LQIFAIADIILRISKSSADKKHRSMGYWVVEATPRHPRAIISSSPQYKLMRRPVGLLLPWFWSCSVSTSVLFVYSRDRRTAYNFGIWTVADVYEEKAVLWQRNRTMPL